jgi:CBS domain-containing protein
MARTVKELLAAKTGDVLTIGPEATVYDAVAMMAREQVGALVVTEKERVTGILTERDYARKVVLENRSSRSTRVCEIMTDRVIYVRSEQPIEECMALMTDKRVRHLPVLDGDSLLGMISIGDVVKDVISEKEFMIDQLTRYNSGH